MSSNENHKYELAMLFIPFIVIGLLYSIIHYLLAYEFIFLNQLGGIQAVNGMIIKISPHLLKVKIFTILLSALLIWQFTSVKPDVSNKRIIYGLSFFIIGLPLFLTYYSVAPQAIKFLFPIGLVATYIGLTILIPLLAITVKEFKPKEIFLDKVNSGIAKEANGLTFKFMTEYGQHLIKNIFAGIYIDGGPGSGKSATVIKQILWQAVKQRFSGLVYDYEGNPNEKSNKSPDDSAPVLSNLVYTGFQHFKPEGVKFGFINFVDMFRTNKCNPIHPDYIKSKTDSNTAAKAILLNLNEDWRKSKIDFWGENAIATLTATIEYQRKHHPDKCTLPHVIALILTDFFALLRMLGEDPRIAADIRPVLSPFKRGATNQASGVESSLQNPISKLNDPKVFYVLGAKNLKDDSVISLDLNNKKKPIMLCIGNDPGNEDILSAPLSLISSTCIKLMNKLNKHHSMFVADELPTAYFRELLRLPAVARKKRVCTVTAVQLRTQLEESYGKGQAEIIRGNLMNYFQGSTPISNTAKEISDELGDRLVKDSNQSHSSSGTSRSESKVKDKYLEINEIKSQSVGHFFVKTMDATHPYLYTQINQFKPEVPVEEIPEFSCPFSSSGMDEKQKQILMDKILEKNQDAIFKEALEQLQPYIEEEEGNNSSKQNTKTQAA